MKKAESCKPTPTNVERAAAEPNVNTDAGGVPDWDLEQLEVIMEDPASWQLVIAGPGAGKSAVACQRVAFLVDEGIPPPRILLVSFTRTAVAELRDRIVSYAVAGYRARSVRISTIDSHAWSLRIGFDDEAFPRVLGEGSYELNIERVINLFRTQQPDLIDFMQRLEHLIIDEAQDVIGMRAELVIEMLNSLANNCGVTILADPAQAIYGFTTDDDETETSSGSLLTLLESKSPRGFTLRRLEQIHRIQEPKLIDVFQKTRQEIEQQKAAENYVTRVQTAIRDTCSDHVGVTSYEDITSLLARIADASTLVLFRRRAEALIASSYCSQAGLEHRLRMSGMPTVVYPWVGWLFGDSVRPIVTGEEFSQLWDRQAARAAAPFEGLNKDECWTLLHRIAAGRKPGTVDLVQLRQVVARTRPPVELCLPECGTTGPILGTIHASKGREADTVLLLMPAKPESVTDRQSPAAAFEEGRVYYVGATRARKLLVVAANIATPVSFLNSRRVFRRFPRNRVQLEIGRQGDVDRLAHLSWENAAEVQLALALSASKTLPLQARSLPERKYALRLVLGLEISEGVTRYVDIGEMSQSFRQELNQIWSIVDREQNLKPALTIPYLYLAAVTTIGLTEEELSAVRGPFNQTGLALAPVVKGFPTIQFLYRSGKGIHNAFLALS